MLWFLFKLHGVTDRRLKQKTGNTSVTISPTDLENKICFLSNLLNSYLPTNLRVLICTGPLTRKSEVIVTLFQGLRFPDPSARLSRRESNALIFQIIIFFIVFHVNLTVLGVFL